MKKIIFSFLLLAFLSSCKECNPGKEEPMLSFDTEGVYGIDTYNGYYKFVFGDLVGSQISIVDYEGICVELQNPNTAIIRFVAKDETKDISVKWAKVEEGKYKISNKEHVAYFYDYRIDRDPKYPDITYILSLKENKPSTKDRDDYTTMGKYFDKSLDYCAESKQQELNTPPDPGPENNWGKDK